MNKIILLLVSVSLITMLSGCLLVPAGYTPDVDLPQSCENKKYAVTFSVDYVADRDDIFGILLSFHKDNY